MGISAFILVDVRGNHTKSAYKTIARIGGIKAIYPVTGAHDIIVHVETESIETLSEIILDKIRSIDGVTKTVTNIVLNI